MDTVSEMAIILAENDVDLQDDYAVTQLLKENGFTQTLINVFIDDAIEEATGIIESMLLVEA